MNGARILVVDDEVANIRVIRHILEPEGYLMKSTRDPRQAVELFTLFEPDLVLLDLLMPGMDGFGVLQALRACVPVDEYLPVLVLTADQSLDAKRRALSSGAKDFLNKPFSAMEMRLRVRNLLETRFLHLRVQHQNTLLEAQVRERTGELEEARLEILERLAQAAEFRDDATGEHTRRVGRMSQLLALTLGHSDVDAETIGRAATLHDVGKIGIPDSVLLKPGRLTAAEFEVMKRHTAIGARILSGSRFPLLQTSQSIALTHHEHWDGTGYPSGLAGNGIPMPGRIVSVVDAYDALRHSRSYKGAWTAEQALDEIDRMSGCHYDPSVVSAFVKSHDAMEAIIADGVGAGDPPSWAVAWGGLGPGPGGIEA